MLAEQFQQYGPELRNYLRKKLGDDCTADDLLQEIFLRFLKTGKQEVLGKPRAYFFATARSVLVDHYRRSKNRRENETRSLDEIEQTVAGPSLSKNLELRQELRIVEAAIAAIPPRAQKAFVLSRIYRFSYAEIGKIMGISPRTVENHVARGLLECTRRLMIATEESHDATVVAFPGPAALHNRDGQK